MTSKLDSLFNKIKELEDELDKVASLSDILVYERISGNFQYKDKTFSYATFKRANVSEKMYWDSLMEMFRDVGFVRRHPIYIRGIESVKVMAFGIYLVVWEVGNNVGYRVGHNPRVVAISNNILIDVDGNARVYLVQGKEDLITAVRLGSKWRITNIYPNPILNYIQQVLKTVLERSLSYTVVACFLTNKTLCRDEKDNIVLREKWLNELKK